MEILDVNSDSVTNEMVLKDREDYAMMALIMFYSFRCMTDLKSDNGYWKKHKKEITEYEFYIQHQNKKHDKYAEQDAQEQYNNNE